MDSFWILDFRDPSCHHLPPGPSPHVACRFHNEVGGGRFPRTDLSSYSMDIEISAEIAYAAFQNENASVPLPFEHGCIHLRRVEELVSVQVS